jgi:hypothetical protein
VSFARLRVADWVAFVAALALLFFMALDWYTTKVGEENRATQHHLKSVPPSPESNTAQVEHEAGQAAESQERNAWQAGGAIDRLALVVLLAAVGLSVAAAFFRAADRRFEPPWTPSAWAAVAGAVATLLVAYRIVQQPGVDETTVLKAGAPLALIAAGIVALASAGAMRNEERGEGFRELPAAGSAEAPPGDAGTAEERRPA